MVLCGTVSSFLTSKMVELVAVFGHSDCASKSRVFKHSKLKFGTL